jgi:site-specific recombinase XerD
MQVLIECSKGKRPLPGTKCLFLDILRRYLKTCVNKPLKYVFESEVPGLPYSSRSAQEVFRLAKKKARIAKDVTFHCPRYSFATDLLEKGISVLYIRDILGHFDIKTTERYLHVRKEVLVLVTSPLDDLWKKGGINL